MPNVSSSLITHQQQQNTFVLKKNKKWLQVVQKRMLKMKLIQIQVL